MRFTSGLVLLAAGCGLCLDFCKLLGYLHYLSCFEFRLCLKLPFRRGSSTHASVLAFLGLAVSC